MFTSHQKVALCPFAASPLPLQSRPGNLCLIPSSEVRVRSVQCVLFLSGIFCSANFLRLIHVIVSNNKQCMYVYIYIYIYIFWLLSCNPFCEYFTASQSFTSWWTFTNLILEPFVGCNSLPMFPLISFYNENRKVAISPEPALSYEFLR